MENVKQLVEYLGFEKMDEKLYRFEFVNISCELKVDISKNIFIYPEKQGLIVENRQTCNFSDPENFVVFECVFRLLQIGYKPENIVIEPKWKVGHGASGGRADILIKDKSGNAFLIIECKTYGKEFDNAWKYMKIDGSQLFTYARQTDGATKYIVLYTSLIEDNNLKREYKLISLLDKGGYIGDNALFLAWKELYKQAFETHGVFEDNCEPFEIGKTKRTTDDLKELSHNDIQKKYHEFATILRKYNVSGRENAFDKLVNLFLAKIVDEANNPDDLLFVWKNASDDYYTMIDRIQRLYRDGMQKFLNEEVTYIENNAIEEAFCLFKNDPDATRDTIMGYFKKLKYYTNNDFALIDVYNEKLFYKNAEILQEIIIMLQDIKLKSDEQNQFLGDLFEGFLDQGVKQSEGQFFTPMPIVRFLVSALPLEKLINDKDEALRVIDYACGAGHFLNEYAAQIRKYVHPHQLSEYYSNIFGIEKEYRLSKVAKVSAFMYGQEEIHTVYGDALSGNEKVSEGSYDILISNPPYSVKGFLETLSEQERNAFDMMHVIDIKSIPKSKSIEVFFIERAKQLLAPSGIAVIILPSSILTNEDAVYTKARETILQYFDMIAIAEFGSGTFGKTGTNTVTLFLRRKAEHPSLSDHYKNRVDIWFKDDFDKDRVFDDMEILMAYCAHIKVNMEDYKTLLSATPNKTLLESSIFETYKTAFDKLTKIKNRMKQKTFQKMTAVDQKCEMDKRFIEYVCEIEKEKLYYFMLAFSNPQPVVIVKSPPEKAEMKKFLGYEWSTKKGNEGIKYLGSSYSDDEDEDKKALSRLRGIKSIQTPLFNPVDLVAPEKINTIIRNNFNGISEGENEFVNHHRLVDMLNFSGVKFNKAISLSAAQVVEINSKYPLVSMDKLAVISRGASPRPIDEYITTEDDGVNWIKIGDVAAGEKYITSTNEKITQEGAKKSKAVKAGDLIISNSMSAGRPYILKISGCIHDGWLLLSDISSDIDRDYFYYVLSSRTVQKSLLSKSLGGVVQNLNTTRVSNLQIPLPPLDIQREIVAACEAADEAYNFVRMNIEEYYKRIDQLFSEMDVIAENRYNLGDTSLFHVSIGRRVTESQLVTNGEMPVYSANVFTPFGYINERLITDFSVPSVLWGIDGDWMVNYMPADVEFYPTDHCGILRVNTDKINLRVLAWCLEQEGNRQGFSRSLRASTSRIKRLIINLPAIEAQNKIAAQVLDYETQIAEAKQRLKSLEIRRKEMLADLL